MRIYVAPLDSSCNRGLVDECPQLARDFWYVEHVVHGVLEGVRCDDPEEADYLYIPHYAMCEYASRIYRRGVSIAAPGRGAFKRATRDVSRTVARVVRMLDFAGLWTEEHRARYLLVFGQGRGAQQGNMLTRFPELRAGRFVGVEARPPDPEAFRIGTDVVIPPHVAHASVARAVRSEGLPKTWLAHFRGRAWGDVRREMFRAVRGRGDDIFLQEGSQYRLGGEGTCRVEEDVWAYYRELARSVFVLCPAGHTPWTLRFYEAMQVGSIPVVTPGTFVPPFADRIDYDRCTLRVPMHELSGLPEFLRAVPDSQIAEMRAYQDEVRDLLDWDAGAPAALLDALAPGA